MNERVCERVSVRDHLTTWQGNIPTQSVPVALNKFENRLSCMREKDLELTQKQIQALKLTGLRI